MSEQDLKDYRKKYEQDLKDYRMHRIVTREDADFVAVWQSCASSNH